MSLRLPKSMCDTTTQPPCRRLRVSSRVNRSRSSIRLASPVTGSASESCQRSSYLVAASVDRVASPVTGVNGGDLPEHRLQARRDRFRRGVEGGVAPSGVGSGRRGEHLERGGTRLRRLVAPSCARLRHSSLDSHRALRSLSWHFSGEPAPRVGPEVPIVLVVLWRGPRASPGAGRVAEVGGGARIRTGVRGFAGPCLNHSATPP